MVAVALTAGCSSGVKRALSEDRGGPPDEGVPVDLATPACAPEDLPCRQVSCGEGATTALVGKVYAPNGTLPLYNALVYVPTAPLSPFTPGVECSVCGAIASGHPLVTALTDATGSFRLENVPVGYNIPLVIQMGRWRRQVNIPRIDPCVDNVLGANDIRRQRLPRNHTEGDIPLIAIATGVFDPVECLLRKLGIDDREFTSSRGHGRVQIFVEDGNDTAPPAEPAQELYADLAEMKRYDVIILPCSQQVPPPEQQANLLAYANAGGRVFATDLMDRWLQQPAWAPHIHWAEPNLDHPLTAVIDQGFPKGKSFASWLTTVGASKVPGELLVRVPYGRLTTVDKPVQRWLAGPDQQGAEADLHFTFNTPVDPPPTDAGAGVQCGRVLYSAFHVSAGSLDHSKPPILPAACRNDPLTDDEKALAFMIFDLTACVQGDDTNPEPPIQ